MKKRKVIQFFKCVLATELTMCTLLIADVNNTIRDIDAYLDSVAVREVQEQSTETIIPIAANKAKVETLEIPTKPLVQAPKVKTYPNLEIPLDDEYKAFVYEQVNFDDDFYCFVMAVIYCESSFDPYNVSSDGHDFGFMQLRDTYHDYYAEKFNTGNPKEPYNNLTIGIGLLKEYIEKHGHKNLALMCYNNGPGSAREKWKDGIYSTKYTVKVLAKYKEYLEQAGL